VVAPIVAAPLPSIILTAERRRTHPQFSQADVGETSYNVNVIVERKCAGNAGAVLKLIDGGYEGILITMSDDSMTGDGSGYGELVWKHEEDTRRPLAGWA